MSKNGYKHVKRVALYMVHGALIGILKSNNSALDSLNTVCMQGTVCTEKDLWLRGKNEKKIFFPAVNLT